MPKSMSPFSSFSVTSCVSPLKKWNTTRGFSLCIFVASRATKETQKDSPPPMRISPAHSSGAASSACVFSYRASISSARFCSKNPASVSSIFLLPRTKSCLPNSFSKFCICRERLGCVMYSDSAALEMLCSRAIARKYLNSRISMFLLLFRIISQYSMPVKHEKLYNIGI